MFKDLQNEWFSLTPSEIEDSPLPMFSLSHFFCFFHIPHEHRCDFGAGRQSRRFQLSIAIAGEDSVLHRPAQSIQGEVSRLIHILEVQLLIGGGRSRVSPEHATHFKLYHKLPEKATCPK